jgi:hypothetical protein
MDTKKKILEVGLVLASIVGPAYAAPSACPTTNVAGSAIDTVNGCYFVDQQFTNVTVSGNNQTSGPAVAVAERYWATGGAITTANTPDTMTQLILHLNGFNAAGANTWVDATVGGSAGTVTSNFRASANTVAPLNQPQESAYHWVYTGINFTPTFSSLTNTDTVSVAVNFCFNATQATVGGTCLSGNQGTFTATWGQNGTGTTGTITSSTTGGTLGSTVTFVSNIPTITSASRYTSVSISSVFTLTNSSSSLGLTEWAIGFNQVAVAPEPSTFGMMGAALLGFGLLARRRRRNVV